MQKLFLFSLCLCVLACESFQEELPVFEGKWVVAGRWLDKEVMTPLPAIIEFKPDSTFVEKFLDGEGNRETYKTQWYIQGDSLYLQDLVTYGTNQYAMENGLLKRRKLYPVFYFRPEKTELPEQTGLIRERLQAVVWESDEEYLKFTPDGALYRLPKDSQKSQLHCWDLDYYEGLSFLVKKGNQTACQTNFQFTEQILKAEADHFEVYRWQKDEMQKISYRPANREVNFELADFQLCNSHLYINHPHHRYYYKGTAYPGGLYAINKLFDAQYKPVKEGENSGIVRVRFVVNCQGKAGLFEVLEMDYDYQVTQLHPDISSQLLTITKQLQNWKAGKNKHGQSIDTYKFLSFKIKNGEIHELFP